MRLVRLIGFRTLDCGCEIGQYRELPTGRDLVYVEEKGTTCAQHAHRRNHTVTLAPVRSSAPRFADWARSTAKAS